jgi:hypothetical protein
MSKGFLIVNLGYEVTQWRESAEAAWSGRKPGLTELHSAAEIIAEAIRERAQEQDAEEAASLGRE